MGDLALRLQSIFSGESECGLRKASKLLSRQANFSLAMMAMQLILVRVIAHKVYWSANSNCKQARPIV
jgi:hypothetical protein